MDEKRWLSRDEVPDHLRRDLDRLKRDIVEKAPDVVGLSLSEALLLQLPQARRSMGEACEHPFEGLWIDQSYGKDSFRGSVHCRRCGVTLSPEEAWSIGDKHRESPHPQPAPSPLPAPASTPHE